MVLKTATWHSFLVEPMQRASNRIQIARHQGEQFRAQMDGQHRSSEYCISQYEGEDSADRVAWQGAGLLCGFLGSCLPRNSRGRQGDQALAGTVSFCGNVLVGYIPRNRCLIAPGIADRMTQVSQGEDGYATIQHTASLTGHSKTVNCIRFSPTGQSWV